MQKKGIRDKIVECIKRMYDEMMFCIKLSYDEVTETAKQRLV